MAKAAILRTLSSQIYSQLSTVGIQLCLIPFLLSFWGETRLSDWMLLTTLPTYLTFSDLGFTYIAKNLMTSYAAQDRRDQAIEVFQSTFVTLLIVAAVVLIATFAGVMVSIPASRFGFQQLETSDFNLSIVFLILSFIVYQFMLLGGASLRACNRPAEEGMWAANIRIADAVVIVAVAYFTTSFVVVAIFCFLVRLLIGVGMYLRVRGLAPWLEFGFRHASKSRMHSLLAPALSHTAATSGNVLLIQSPVLILGFFGLGTWIVPFTAMRTLSRITVSVGNAISNSFVPQYSRLFGQSRFSDFRRLVTLNLLVSSVLALLSGVVIYFLGDLIVSIWTLGKVEIVQPIFNLLNGMSIVEVIWLTMFNALAACNLHIKTSLRFSLFVLIGLTSATILARSGSFTGIVASVFLVHLGMLIASSLALYSLLKSQRDAILTPVNVELQ